MQISSFALIKKLKTFFDETSKKQVKSDLFTFLFSIIFLGNRASNFLEMIMLTGYVALLN